MIPPPKHEFVLQILRTQGTHRQMRKIKNTYVQADRDTIINYSKLQTEFYIHKQYK